MDYGIKYSYQLHDIIRLFLMHSFHPNIFIDRLLFWSQLRKIEINLKSNKELLNTAKFNHLKSLILLEPLSTKPKIASSELAKDPLRRMLL